MSSSLYMQLISYPPCPNPLVAMVFSNVPKLVRYLIHCSLQKNSSHSLGGSEAFQPWKHVAESCSGYDV